MLNRISTRNTRNAIESTYQDRCDIYKLKDKKIGSVTEKVMYKAYSQLKCALSQKSIKTANQTDQTNIIRYDAKLFIMPEIDIPAGCEIWVYSHGRKLRFISSGEAFVYETHQEIMLLRNERA